MLKLNRMKNHVIISQRKNLIDMLLPSAILFILLLIIDPSQRAMTIRLNSVYLADNIRGFGPPEQDQDGDIFDDLGKYAMDENLTIQLYGTLSFDN